MMRRSVILSLILAIAVGGVKASLLTPTKEALAASTKINSVPTDTVLKLRGGAGPLDATKTANVGSAIGILSGIVHSINAGKMLELYGLGRNPILDVCMRRIGASISGFAIPCYLL